MCFSRIDDNKIKTYHSAYLGNIMQGFLCRLQSAGFLLQCFSLLSLLLLNLSVRRFLGFFSIDSLVSRLLLITVLSLGAAKLYDYSWTNFDTVDY